MFCLQKGFLSHSIVPPLTTNVLRIEVVPLSVKLNVRKSSEMPKLEEARHNFYALLAAVLIILSDKESVHTVCLMYY